MRRRQRLPFFLPRAPSVRTAHWPLFLRCFRRSPSFASSPYFPIFEPIGAPFPRGRQAAPGREENPSDAAKSMLRSPAGGRCSRLVGGSLRLLSRLHHKGSRGESHFVATWHLRCH